MKEVWKIISGYDHPYEISNMGRVKFPAYTKYNGKGVQYVPERITYGTPNGQGYLSVALMRNNKSKTVFVHRLVGNAFIPNPHNKPQIDHINTISTDNKVSNLRWVTQAENNANILTREHRSISHRNLPRGKNPMAKKVHDEINNIEYECATDYAIAIGRNPKTVMNWLQGRYKFPSGYKAHYKEEK